jgi:gamma-glutamyltranspeptidase/glutathione hydrolase
MSGVKGSIGLVLATHELASNISMQILRLGGNAFDAAVAVGFALQVVQPHECGLGGEAVILATRSGEERPIVICGQGTIPKAATISYYRGLGLAQVPGSGPLAAVVPGAALSL